MSRSFGGNAVHDAIADQDLAFADFLESGDHAQQRGLAAAGGPDQDRELAVGDLDVDAVDHGRSAEALGNAANRDLRHKALSPPRGREVPLRSTCGDLRPLNHRIHGASCRRPLHDVHVPPCAAARLPPRSNRTPRAASAARAGGAPADGWSLAVRSAARRAPRRRAFRRRAAPARRRHRPPRLVPCSPAGCRGACAPSSGVATMPRVSSVRGTCSETMSLCSNSVSRSRVRHTRESRRR